jgi:hypothetical protein
VGNAVDATGLDDEFALIDGEMQCSRATAVGEVEGLNTDCFRPILSMLLIIYTLVSPQIATLLLLY